MTAIHNEVLIISGGGFQWVDVDVWPGWDKISDRGVRMLSWLDPPPTAAVPVDAPPSTVPMRRASTFILLRHEFYCEPERYASDRGELTGLIVTAWWRGDEPPHLCDRIVRREFRLRNLRLL